MAKKHAVRSGKPPFSEFPTTRNELDRDARHLTRLLKGKRVVRVFRPRKTEVCIEFADGGHFFFGPLVNVARQEMDVSVT